jgi:hypothetical protein
VLRHVRNGAPGWISQRGCALTVEDFIDLVSDVLGGFGVGNNDTGGAGVEGRCQADLVMLGDAADDQSLALGVMLCGMDAARGRQDILRFNPPSAIANLLVEGRAVEYGVLNVDPNEVGFGRGHDLQS